MDSSQSSDIFSDLTNHSCTEGFNAMDVNTYESLLNNTKSSLSRNISTLTIPSHSDYLTSLLENCRLCITQAINLLNEILLESHISTEKLRSYLDDAISILQLLSDYIKNVVESISISCSTMKTFPTTTSQIIKDVFIHCKNSESTYGTHLNAVQQQLKDLFRTCHELQLTYLMVLEKHFVFDLSEKEECCILVEALNINLHIGEIVQALDVKTMAEQWKAYTMICEKYANNLMDTPVYQDCTILLCAMVLNNMKTALELEQDERLIVRSMKVTNFTIKILLKMCTIFRHSQMKPHHSFLELLINVHIINTGYLESMEEKSPQFINIILTNVLNPVNLLLDELLADEDFVNVILNYNINNLRQIGDLLGYILLIATMMKSASQKQVQKTFPKSKVINCLFKLLPECYLWINMGLKYEVDINNTKKSVGLFEYLLIYTAQLALKMNREEYYVLEKNMCESILDIDYTRAIFASNLWIILTRSINNNQLLFNQLISLCQMYQKLETNKQFSRSPQKVYLASTMSSLFELATIEDRVKIYKQFNPLINAKYISLWSILKIKKLPLEFQKSVEEDIMDKLKTEFQKFSSGYQYKESFAVINALKLAATCSYNALKEIEDILLAAWSKACPKNLHFLSDALGINMMWFLDYLDALVSLTFAMKYTIYDRSSNVVKILHVISELLRLGNTELKLILMKLLCNLGANQVHDENKAEAAKLTDESFKIIIEDSDAFIRNTFFRVISRCEDKQLHQIVSSIVCGDHSLTEAWQHFINSDKNKKSNKINLKEHLILVNSYKYRHKCVEFKDVKYNNVSVSKQNSCSSNFDFADIDTLFDNESDAEPASKKPKFDISEIEAILDRLEQDTTLLCDFKENVFAYKHKKRIRLLYEKLVNIISNE